MAPTAFSSAEELASAVEARRESWILPRITSTVNDLTTAEVYLFAATRDGLVVQYDLSPAGEVPPQPPQLVDSVQLARSPLCLAAGATTLYLADGGCDIARHNWSDRSEIRNPSLPSRQAPAAASDLDSEGWAFESLWRQLTRGWDQRAPTR